MMSCKSNVEVATYAIVEFTEDGLVSEVPTIWLTDKCTSCWWPPTKNVSSLILKAAMPYENTWVKYPVRLETYCSKLYNI